MQSSDLRVFGESEGDLGLLKDKTIAVLGYGNLGRPLALNLRDSGIQRIVVGEHAPAATQLAQDDGFAVETPEHAASSADMTLLLVPDEVQSNVFHQYLHACLRPGSAVVFASGYSLTFDSLPISADIDVLLFAPRMLGKSIRQLYLENRGYYSFVFVEQDATGSGWPRLLALAKACGSLRRGALPISARQEAHLDLFAEQGVGPWIGAAIMAALRVGQERGLPLQGLIELLLLDGRSHVGVVIG